MIIVSSRTLITEQTDRQTEISIYWAVDLALSNFILGELLRERLKHQAAGVKITNGDYTRVPLNDHNQTF